MAGYKHPTGYKHPRYTRYRPFPMGQVYADSKTGHVKRYRVSTINRTYATEDGKIDRTKVHHNEYSWTLRDLIRFLRETEDTVEDIIEIQPEVDSLRK